MHIPGIEAKAEFSPCAEFRYRLTLIDRRKTAGRTVCVIMQNPSVANEQIADKSVQFLEKLIFEKGLPEFSHVSRCIVVNQFSRVQTHDFHGKPEDLGKDNDTYIRKAIEESDIVIIAWGKNNPYGSRQKAILDMLDKSTGKFIYRTKKHPSRGTYRDFVIPYCT